MFAACAGWAVIVGMCGGVRKGKGMPTRLHPTRPDGRTHRLRWMHASAVESSAAGPNTISESESSAADVAGTISKGALIANGERAAPSDTSVFAFPRERAGRFSLFAGCTTLWVAVCVSFDTSRSAERRVRIATRTGREGSVWFMSTFVCVVLLFHVDTTTPHAEGALCPVLITGTE